MDTWIKNAKIVIPQVGIVEGSIAIKDGKIAAILQPGETCEATEVYDAQGKYVLPGLIDPHVHWGLYGATLAQQADTESRSAALGGVTSVRMYRRVPKYEESAVADIVNEVSSTTHIDWILQPFVTKNEHIEGMKMAHEKFGVTSFKAFTTERVEQVNSNINGFSDKNIPEPYTDGFVMDFLQEIASIPGAVANIHPENYEIVERTCPRTRDAGLQGLAAWDKARPTYAEAETCGRLAYFSELTGAPVYLVHISCKEAADIIAQHKKTNPHLYAETTPHYLALSIDSPCGILGKVNPPLRTADNNDALWKALSDGTLDTIGSDNCAATLSYKEGDIWDADPGFAGTATILPVMLSEGYNKGRITLQRLAEVTSYNTAKIFGMYPQKGTIMVGSDADLVVIDTELEKTVQAKDLLSWADFSVFDGVTLKGWPVATFRRGELIAKDGEILSKPGSGKYLG